MNKTPKPPVGGKTLVKLWKKDRADLTSLLLDYGGHRWDCPAHEDEHGFFVARGPCECGWAEVRASLCK